MLKVCGGNVRVICNLIASDKPVCDKCKVGVTDLSEVGHLRRAPIRVLPVCEDIVDRIDRVRLNSIITVIGRTFWGTGIRSGYIIQK